MATAARSSSTPDQTVLGNATRAFQRAHQTRKVRNFVHPGVRAGERSDPLKFTKGLYGVVYEIAEVANAWLLHRVEKNLLKAMKKEDSRKFLFLQSRKMQNTKELLALNLKGNRLTRF